MSDKNNFMEEPSEEMTVTLTLDDGSQLECVILTIFEAGGRDYIALLPMEGEDADEGEVYLYRYTEIDGNPDLQNIEDDEEFFRSLPKNYLALEVEEKPDNTAVPESFEKGR